MAETRDGSVTREQFKTILKPGKSIKVGGTWYTIAKASSRAEGVLLATADWEMKKGKKDKSFIATYDTIEKNVKAGKWNFKWKEGYVDIKN